MTFGTMKVVRSSPLRTGRLHPQEFSWHSFLEAESIAGHMVRSAALEKIPSDTTGIDPETLRLVVQRLNHYATTSPMYKVVQIWPGQTVTCLHTNSPGHIRTTLYYMHCLYFLCNYVSQNWDKIIISVRTVIREGWHNSDVQHAHNDIDAFVAVHYAFVITTHSL
jgi:hypothetical protein